MAQVQAEKVKMSRDEIGEKKSNRNNVIIHQVPETSSNKPSERQAHDAEKLKTILTELGLMRFMKA